MTGKTKISQSVINYFAGNNWRALIFENLPVVNIQFVGKNATWTCSAYTYDDREQLAFYSNIPLLVSKDKRNIMSEFLTRANFGQILGNWEYDLDLGKIRFKTSIDVEGMEISTQSLNQVIYTNVLTADKSIPGIRSILERDLTPLEAINLIEKTDIPKEDTSKDVNFEKIQPN